MTNNRTNHLKVKNFLFNNKENVMLKFLDFSIRKDHEVKTTITLRNKH